MRNQGWEQEPERGGGRAATPFNSVPPPLSPHTPCFPILCPPRAMPTLLLCTVCSHAVG